MVDASIVNRQKETSMNTDKVPQNIQDLVGEIGERMVLFKLYELVHGQPKLEIFKNYSDSGYDVGIRNIRTGEKLKIEVKTRQHLISTAEERSKNSCHFTLTQNERDKADILIGYWLEFNDFFVVPVEKLKPSKHGKNKDQSVKYVFKHIVSRLKNPDPKIGLYSIESMPHLNNWKSIFEYLRKSKNK